MKRCAIQMTQATLFAGVAFSASGAVRPVDRPVERPNIIIFFTDDQGYADLGIIGSDPDVKTPHLDLLARDGVLFTRGYATAPQCIPSRAGLIAGRHQNAFGLDDNSGGPLPHSEYTIAERLRDAGYATGMVGKWHLEIAFMDEPLPCGRRHYHSIDHYPHRHGFEEMFAGYTEHYEATYDLDGNDVESPHQSIIDPHFRVDIQTRAALAFLERRRDDDRPFFLYVCHYAPHAPMEDPPQYMKLFEQVEEVERRMGLAAVYAIDQGVGLIREKLEQMGQTGNTLIFFISDNGAPLRPGAYVGSFNTPLVGEKGMQTDGGQRVPFIAAWPGTIPGGQVFDEMVWSLDAAATAVAVGQAPVDDRIEGKNLIPWLTGRKSGPVHEALYWRWRSQATILTPEWKFIRLGNERSYLFRVDEIGKQTAEHNVVEQYPEVAAELERRLRAKADTWARTGLPDHVVAPDREFYDQHVEQTLPPLPLGQGQAAAYVPWDASRPTPSVREWCAPLLQGGSE